MLLADGCQRRRADREVLPRVPILPKVDSFLGPRALDNPHHKVVCRMGPGPSGTLQDSARGLNPPTRCG
jgi:hypothetical protein